MKRLIFAFPGMGKTPTCRRLPNCMDLDFGMFRNALEVEKKDEVTIFPQFIRLIDEYYSENWRIFTNEPKLLDSRMLYSRIPQSEIVMYLPVGKGLAYCARKMQVDVDQIAEWVEDWRKIADRNGIRVIDLYVGLDYYLQANPLF